MVIFAANAEIQLRTIEGIIPFKLASTMHKMLRHQLLIPIIFAANISSQY